MQSEVNSNFSVSRRQFIAIGGKSLGCLPFLGLPKFESNQRRRAVIQILLVGGPSQLETFDPKPEAPGEIRGPFSSIATRIPGVRLSESLPRLAQRLDRIALLRGVYHNLAPIHETGLQLLQTGTAFDAEAPIPHLGQRLGTTCEVGASTRPWLLLPGPLGDTGVPLPTAQSCAVPLWHRRTPATRMMETNVYPRNANGDRYGAGHFAQSLADAVDAVASGVRLVTVNMFETVFHRISWDVHGVGGELPTTFADYSNVVCPMFDRAFCAMMDDLHDRRLLDDVLVVAAGEFGRTPRINRHGGRDHWPGAWSALVAGGGICPGVYGRTDAFASEPVENAISAADLARIVADYLGIGGTPGWHHNPNWRVQSAKTV